MKKNKYNKKSLGQKTSTNEIGLILSKTHALQALHNSIQRFAKSAFQFSTFEPTQKISQPKS